MIFGDLVGLKLPEICLIGEEKLGINLTQEICPDRGSNPGPLRDKRSCVPPWDIVTIQFVSPEVRNDNSKRLILSWTRRPTCHG